MGTTKLQDKKRNPLTMTAEIKREAVRCLNEYRDGKSAEEIEKGLYRLKKLDKELYGQYVNEQIAAHLIIRMMHCLLPFVQVEHMMSDAKNPSLPTHISGLSKSVDAAATLLRLKKGLEKFGFSEIPGDELWNACIDYLQQEQNAWSFWVAIDIWNEIFEGKFELNISFKELEQGIQLLRALVNDTGTVSPSHFRITKISDTKVFLEQIDRIIWVDRIEDETKQEKGDNSFWKARHSFEESVLREKDRELLFNCFEKNVFPKEDTKFLFVTAMTYKKNDLLPLILLKEHECL